MRIIELFSGRHKSFATQAKRLGHEVLTVDIDPDNKPDIVADIGVMTMVDIPEHWHQPDIIWASPPCQRFSVASIGKYWQIVNNVHTPRNQLAAEAQMLIAHVVTLIHQLAPDYWVIENPRGKLRKLYPVTVFKRHTVTYCQYGDTRMKPTDLWCSDSLFQQWTPRPMCKNGDPCHTAAPRGSTTGTQNPNEDPLDRSRVPGELCEEILTAVISTAQQQLTFYNTQGGV